MAPNYRVLLEKANERIALLEELIANQEELIDNQMEIVDRQKKIIELADKRMMISEQCMDCVRRIMNGEEIDPKTLSIRSIYLAGGCFWGMQKYFDQFDGVLWTQVGYANGPDKAPSYEDVCADSGHAETVRIVYDESVISLEKLLDDYFMVIDPVSVNKQGHDEGIQYRTGIYYTSEDQKSAIDAVYEREEKKAGTKLAVEVEPLRNFFPAEEYHQEYLEKNPGGYCHIPKEYFSPEQKK